jgi:hypothetical protein
VNRLSATDQGKSVLPQGWGRALGLGSWCPKTHWARTEMTERFSCRESPWRNCMTFSGRRLNTGSGACTLMMIPRSGFWLPMRPDWGRRTSPEGLSPRQLSTCRTTKRSNESTSFTCARTSILLIKISGSLTVTGKHQGDARDAIDDAGGAA